MAADLIGGSCRSIRRRRRRPPLRDSEHYPYELSRAGRNHQPNRAWLGELYAIGSLGLCTNATLDSHLRFH
jgi:hypothetical protein